MAKFNEILVGRFNRAVQKLTGIKGGPPTAQLGSEILPVFPFFWGVENRYLESWNKFGLAFSINAVAANLSGFRFRNPSGSNVIAVIEKLNFDNISAGAEGVNVILGQGGDLSVVSAGTRMDARFTPNFGTGANIITSQQNTTPTLPLTNTATMAFVNLGLTSSQVDVIINHDQQLPCLPGDLWQFSGSAVNQNLTGEIWWRERFLEDSERT